MGGSEFQREMEEGMLYDEVRQLRTRKLLRWWFLREWCEVGLGRREEKG